MIERRKKTLAKERNFKNSTKSLRKFGIYGFDYDAISVKSQRIEDEVWGPVHCNDGLATKKRDRGYTIYEQILRPRGTRNDGDSDNVDRGTGE